MPTMTFDDLMTLLEECAGSDESIASGPDDIDTPFDDLGYDSLALLETSGRIERDYGIKLDEGRMPDLRTPRLLLDAINHSQAATT